MRSFSDAAGRQWSVEINVNAIKRVRALLPGVDLASPDKGEPPLFVRLCDDAVLLCDVLYCLVKPQADSMAITDEQFGASIGPEGLAAGTDALLGELSDFFRKLGRRELAALITKTREVQQVVIDQREAVLIGMKAEDCLKPVSGN